MGSIGGILENSDYFFTEDWVSVLDYFGPWGVSRREARSHPLRPPASLLTHLLTSSALCSSLPGKLLI